MCTRVPIKIPEGTPKYEVERLTVFRKPVTIFTDLGMSRGGWYAFPKPNYEPHAVKLRKNQYQLWCPYCNEYTIFQKGEDRYFCKGVCGWSNSEDFHVKFANGLWGSPLR